MIRLGIISSIGKTVIEAERDAIVAQKKMAEAKNTELEVVTFIEISKLKANPSNSNKEIKKLWEGKKNWRRTSRGLGRRP